MKTKKILVCSIILLAMVAFFNIFMGAATTVTASVKGTGDAYEKIDKEAGTRTWGCDRKNENQCSMTATSTY